MISNRLEKDSMGTVNVSSNRLWGACTQRSLKYFCISTEKVPERLIYALALTKKATTLVNKKLGLLPNDKAIAIIKAIDEVLDNKHSEEFPLVIWQSGSGTQTHMNINEVLANRASEILGGVRGISRLIHPNDDINKGQSSNDVFSTAMHIATILSLEETLIPSIKELIDTFNKKSIDFIDLVKVGRTHLQDAVPITLGQEISGWCTILKDCYSHINNNKLCLSAVPIGGTAVGTGLNTHSKFADLVVKELTALTKHNFIVAPNKFAVLSTCDSLVHVHSSLKNLAISIMKIANDIRWLASGPRCGIGEINIPENEPGSSIMPGKVNPTQCEAISMICCQVIGNDVAINIGGASGNFELNVYRPMIIYNILQSIRLLSDGIRSFNKYCAVGITPNYERINELLSKSLMLVTALNDYVGYDKAAEIAKKAHKENITLKESALILGYINEKDFDNIINPKQMATKNFD